MLGKPWEGCGFKGLGVICITKVDVFLHIIFEIPLSTFFLLLEHPSGPFGVHFGAILSSKSLLVLKKSFF